MSFRSRSDKNTQRKNMCKCLACGTRFEFKDAYQKPTFSAYRPACPNCKSERLETLSLENYDDHSYMNGFARGYRS